SSRLVDHFSLHGASEPRSQVVTGLKPGFGPRSRKPDHAGAGELSCSHRRMELPAVTKAARSLKGSQSTSRRHATLRQAAITESVSRVGGAPAARASASKGSPWNALSLPTLLNQVAISQLP